MLAQQTLPCRRTSRTSEPMKNYTSTVAPERSIALIEEKLIAAGATAIAKECEGGRVVAVSFMIRAAKDKNPVTIRLPAKVQQAYAVLTKKKGALTQSQRERMMKQASQTAWRIVYDWVCIQLAMIELEQVDLLQVFMPFIWDGKQSLYHAMLQSNSPALGHSAKDGA